jgi:holo-[acyl-carrier protein] synthase
MVRGIGIDMIEVARIAAVAERHGQRFLRRIYTPLELEKLHGNRHQYLAARFAAKEAVFKALGTGWGGGVRWVEVEVDNLPSGQPVLTLTGAALARADALKVGAMHLTISHTAGHAVAQVILEGTDELGGA